MFHGDPLKESKYDICCNGVKTMVGFFTLTPTFLLKMANNKLDSRIKSLSVYGLIIYYFGNYIATNNSNSYFNCHWFLARVG